ncbi:MAG: hypothetical protein M5R36_30025 [Deltaproteobacteria bacterium]|nr:hypothetical protein [Deltaproteobacteria bacterium]
MFTDKKPEQKFDVRMIERYRARGLFDDKQWAEWLKSLSDASGNAETIPASAVMETPDSK